MLAIKNKSLIINNAKPDNIYYKVTTSTGTKTSVLNTWQQPNSDLNSIENNIIRIPNVVGTYMRLCSNLSMGGDTGETSIYSRFVYRTAGTTSWLPLSTGFTSERTSKNFHLKNISNVEYYIIKDSPIYGKDIEFSTEIKTGIITRLNHTTNNSSFITDGTVLQNWDSLTTSNLMIEIH